MVKHVLISLKTHPEFVAFNPVIWIIIVGRFTYLCAEVCYPYRNSHHELKCIKELKIMAKYWPVLLAAV